MNNIDSIRERIEQGIAPAMRAHYMSRLDKLVSTRASDDAWQSFLKRLQVAEELSASVRFTPPRRVRT